MAAFAKSWGAQTAGRETKITRDEAIEKCLPRTGDDCDGYQNPD
jgi:hypothetical protein